LEQLSIKHYGTGFPNFPSMSEYLQQPSSQIRIPLQKLRALRIHRIHGYNFASGDIYLSCIASYAPPLETLSLSSVALSFVDPRLFPVSLRHITLDWSFLDSR
jgi:hypothetical protein